MCVFFCVFLGNSLNKSNEKRKERKQQAFTIYGSEKETLKDAMSKVQRLNFN